MTKKTPKILIVDDELKICESCQKILLKSDYMVEYALNGYDALKMMDEAPFAVVITDLKMSVLGGMEVLSRIKESYPDTRVIVITGYATVSSAVEVMKMGASDYLPKPFTPHELRSVVRQVLSERDMFIQNKRLIMEQNTSRSISHQLIGTSPKIRNVISMIEKVAATDSTVLVYGESGTGKELVSRAVHANSNRKNMVFFAVDCGALSENILESELFGHVRGSFTGAHKDKDGIFKLADNGTVFLDEISNITPKVQGKLLRFLETREFLPVGGTNPVKVNVRLIFATNENLEEMVSDKSFREDFYYRIFVYPIIIPPLRERGIDILPIAYHFLKQFSQTMGKIIKGFDDRAVERLTSFGWPGNVRQLRNFIERAVILCDKDRITLRDLPFQSDFKETEDVLDPAPVDNEELKKIKKEIRQKAVNNVEKQFIQAALSRNGWNVTKAAQSVGMQRTNFQNMMKKHHIVLPIRKNIP